MRRRPGLVTLAGGILVAILMILLTWSSGHSPTDYTQDEIEFDRDSLVTNPLPPRRHGNIRPQPTAVNAGPQTTLKTRAKIPLEGSPLPKGLHWMRRHDDNLTIDETLSPAEAEVRFLKLVSRVHVDCRQSVRLGHVGDGGWDVCLVPPFAPAKHHCLVYSFGINYDWSFDEAISRNYGCVVRSFDPSMKGMQDHKRGQSVWFYRRGLAGHNSVDKKTGWVVQTLGSYLTQFSEQNRVLDYVKLDIEYNEWESLEGMFTEHVLPRVKQLALEIHTREMLPGNPTTTLAQLSRYWRILRRLEDVGFRRWYSHVNPQGVYLSSRTGQFISCCFELVYVNLNYLPGKVNVLPPLNLTAPVNVPSRGAARSAGATRIDDLEPTRFPASPVSPLDPKDILDESSVQLASEFNWIFQEEEIEIHTRMDPYLAESLFFDYVQTLHVTCPTPVRVGNRGDGGWDLCMAPPYTLHPPCVVYSFGIGNEWSFDDVISGLYGCEVLAFDPSMRKKQHRRGEKIHFYPLGLNGTNTTSPQGWRMRTFGQFLAMFNHSQVVVDVLKVDVEYSEWAALEAMFQEGSLRRVRQLVIEVHTREVLGHVTSLQDFRYYWRLLRKLHLLGFRRWHAHVNTAGQYFSSRSNNHVSCCYELSYLNLHFMGPQVSDP